MRKLVALPLLGVVALAAVLAAPTIAQDNPSQTELTLSGKVSPKKVGTPKHPQGVTLTADVHWSTPPDFDKPVVQGATTLIPKGGLYNGGKYPTCAENTMVRSGLRNCPAKSIMGKGFGVAYADTVITKPQITVVNGGKNKMYFFTVLNNPARVALPVPATLKKKSGKWAYEVTFKVPTALQVVAGVPIALRDLHVVLGGKSWAKDWLATTACPNGKNFPFVVTTFFDNGGSAMFEDSVACSK